jgi:hypothetical protein
MANMTRGGDGCSVQSLNMLQTAVPARGRVRARRDVTSLQMRGQLASDSARFRRSSTPREGAHSSRYA